MNSVLLDLGLIKIYWYSVFIFLAFLVSGSLAIREGKKWNISEDNLINMFFFLIPISIIGARLYYVIFNWSFYSNNLLEIIEVWNGGLAIHGGVIAGLIFVLIYCKKHKINTFRMTDIIAVSLILGQAIGRWGNFFNQEAHGSEVTLEFLQKFIPFQFIIDGMHINGTYYHPTFLYESLWCLLGFIVLIIIRKFKYLKIGQLTGIYLFWYGIGRFFIESLRTDSLMFNDFKVAQIVSVICMVVGTLIIVIRGRGFKLEGRYNTPLVTEKPKELEVNQFIKNPQQGQTTPYQPTPNQVYQPGVNNTQSNQTINQVINNQNNGQNS